MQIKIIDASAPNGMWLKDADAERHIGQIVEFAQDHTVDSIGRQMGMSWFRVQGPRGMDQAIGAETGSPAANALLELA